MTIIDIESDWGNQLPVKTHQWLAWAATSDGVKRWIGLDGPFWVLYDDRCCAEPFIDRNVAESIAKVWATVAWLRCWYYVLERQAQRCSALVYTSRRSGGTQVRRSPPWLQRAPADHHSHGRPVWRDHLMTTINVDDNCAEPLLTIADLVPLWELVADYGPKRRDNHWFVSRLLDDSAEELRDLRDKERGYRDMIIMDLGHTYARILKTARGQWKQHAFFAINQTVKWLAQSVRP